MKVDCGEYVIPYNKFDFSNISNKFTLITSYSYEDRIIDSLKNILDKFIINNVIIINYQEEYYLDDYTIVLRKKKVELINKILKNKKLKIYVIDCKYDNTTNIENYFSNKKLYKNDYIFDLTGVTSNYILKITDLLNNNIKYFFYTRSEDYRIPNDREMSVSFDKIIILNGFEGFVHTDKKDLIMIFLGYEGNRALSFLKKYEIEPLYVIISHPHSQDESKNKLFIDSVKEANRTLLNVHRVKLYDGFVHSLNPIIFSEEVLKVINNFPNIDSYNICITCLGSKLQSLGLYFFWKKNQNCQLLYSIPVKRFDIRKGVGTSLIIINPLYNYN